MGVGVGDLRAAPGVASLARLVGAAIVWASVWVSLRGVRRGSSGPRVMAAGWWVRDLFRAWRTDVAPAPAFGLGSLARQAVGGDGMGVGMGGDLRAAPGVASLARLVRAAIVRASVSATCEESGGGHRDLG
jgi:hypothetical protein